MKADAPPTRMMVCLTCFPEAGRWKAAAMFEYHGRFHESMSGNGNRYVIAGTTIGERAGAPGGMPSAAPVDDRR